MPAEATVCAKSTVPACRTVSSAMLRRNWHPPQQEHERRNEKRTMHSPIISPIQAVRARNRNPLGHHRFLDFAFFEGAFFA
jgi:hypothetical protein